MTLRITLILVLGLTPLAAQTTKDVQDYLPLAVGNSWTYTHEFFDARSGIAAPIYLTAEFTISILRTEVIDGETYYVFSDISTTMPEGLPNHFLNGKKLRWDGNHLTEHDGTASFSLYRFRTIPPGGGRIEDEYSIRETHGDTLVKTAAQGTDRLAHQYFGFRGNPGGSSGLSFYGDFGMYRVITGRASGDMIVLRNTITAIRAVFQTTDRRKRWARDTRTSSSVTVEWEDFRCYYNKEDIKYGTTCNYPPTSSSASTWGSIKDRSDNR